MHDTEGTNLWKLAALSNSADRLHERKHG